ncbi:aminotransferase class I/II-fold pyridoxal phosphate-dependent enzyme [Phytoactinopolyspora limicola]|uniref:aminotransferase class I/II-fold pyridoxal phosphate-dependent enzyme n=1 Tax=Phytoactinopolyspora limicola TaxID=2715536 RepID=UPI00140761A1|nr:aminotransferase class I/II-fold pyridoxal phosphate-dependent enzyme [Phytoactinopolyspora limicola]
MGADTLIAGKTSRDIAASVETAVAVGDLVPLQPLPSVRELAARLGVSPSTVAAAYRDLRMRGVVLSEAGRATRVGGRPPVAPSSTARPVEGESAAVRAPAPSSSNLRDVSDGNPDPELLPDLSAVLATVESPRYLYGAPTIVPELAEMAQELFADVADQLGHHTGPPTVVGGALDGAERVLGAWARPGDRVVIEDPGHTGVLDLVRAMGLEPVGVAVDAAGVVPDDLERALGRQPVAFVVTPRAHNPTGAAIDDERAVALRAVLARHPDMTVVENDHASLIAGAPYVSLSVGRQRWAVLRSASKFLGPDLRLAFVAADPRTLSRVSGRQLLGTGWVSHLLQHLVVALWAVPEVRDTVRHAERVYHERRQTLLDQLSERGIMARGRSGLNVTIPVEHEAPVIQQMQTRGWGLRAGEVHRMRSAPFVRVTTATLRPDESTRLAADLAAVLEHRSASHLT